MIKFEISKYFYIIIIIMIISGCATTKQYVKKPQQVELYDDYSRIKFIRPNIPYCTACPVKK